jgi:hypothetical protein
VLENGDGKSEKKWKDFFFLVFVEAFSVSGKGVGFLDV